MAIPKQIEAQQVLYNRLVSNADLAQLVAAEDIVNHRPQGKNGFDNYPTVLFRIRQSAQYDTKDSAGYEQLLQFDVWSKEHGDKEVWDIIDAIVADLHNQELSTTSGQSLLLQYRDARVIPDDSVSHHGVLEFTHLYTE